VDKSLTRPPAERNCPTDICFRTRIARASINLKLIAERLYQTPIHSAAFLNIEEDCGKLESYIQRYISWLQLIAYNLY
jgi:hypothetical protein